jgi:hypothetical protein
MLLRLLRPAVDVDVRPLPPFTNGGVGGGSSDCSLAEPMVDDRSRFPNVVGGARADEDWMDPWDVEELCLSNVPGVANESEAAADVATAAAGVESFNASIAARNSRLAWLER